MNLNLKLALVSLVLLLGLAFVLSMLSTAIGVNDHVTAGVLFVALVGWIAYRKIRGK